MKIKLTYYAKLLLVCQTIFFLPGLLFSVESTQFLYYYLLWFEVAGISNLSIIIWLFIRRPERYIWYCAALVATPVIALKTIDIVLTSSGFFDKF